MAFRITGLPSEPFKELFSLSDAELAERQAIRVKADESHGFPCRISLTDATPGQSLILLNYQHQAADSPYRASHAIYIREGEQQYDEVDQVPEQLQRRLLSVRGFDTRGMMLDADVVEGKDLEPLIARLFANASIDYLQIHIARPGCYAARVERA
jgi:hypothetical protein